MEAMEPIGIPAGYRGRNALGVTNEKKKAVEPLQKWFGENGVSPETPELAFCGEG
jgi:hypothetical protein